MADSDVPENKGWKGPYRGDFLSLAPLQPLRTPMATSVEGAEAYTVTRRPTGIAQEALSHGRFASFTGVLRTTRTVAARRPGPSSIASPPESGGVPIPENPWDESDSDIVETAALPAPSSLPPRTPTPRPASRGVRPAPPRGAAPRRSMTPADRRVQTRATPATPTAPPDLATPANVTITPEGQVLTNRLRMRGPQPPAESTSPTPSPQEKEPVRATPPQAPAATARPETSPVTPPVVSQPPPPRRSLSTRHRGQPPEVADAGSALPTPPRPSTEPSPHEEKAPSTRSRRITQPAGAPDSASTPATSQSSPPTPTPSPVISSAPEATSPSVVQRRPSASPDPAPPTAAAFAVPEVTTSAPSSAPTPLPPPSTSPDIPVVRPVVQRRETGTSTPARPSETVTSPVPQRATSASSPQPSSNSPGDTSGPVSIPNVQKPRPEADSPESSSSASPSRSGMPAVSPSPATATSPVAPAVISTQPASRETTGPSTTDAPVPAGTPGNRSVTAAPSAPSSPAIPSAPSSSPVSARGVAGVPPRSKRPMAAESETSPPVAEMSTHPSSPPSPPVRSGTDPTSPAIPLLTPTPPQGSAIGDPRSPSAPDSPSSPRETALAPTTRREARSDADAPVATGVTHGGEVPIPRVEEPASGPSKPSEQQSPAATPAGDLVQPVVQRRSTATPSPRPTEPARSTAASPSPARPHPLPVVETPAAAARVSDSPAATTPSTTPDIAPLRAETDRLSPSNPAPNDARTNAPLSGSQPLPTTIATPEFAGVTQRRTTGTPSTTRGDTPPDVTEESVRVPRDVQEAVAQVTGHRPEAVTVRRGPEVNRTAARIAADSYATDGVVHLPGTAPLTSDRSRRLLAHELTHVVQQKSGKAPTHEASSAGREAEHQALSAETALSAGTVVTPSLTTDARPTVARSTSPLSPDRAVSLPRATVHQPQSRPRVPAPSARSSSRSGGDEPAPSSSESPRTAPAPHAATPPSPPPPQAVAAPPAPPAPVQRRAAQVPPAAPTTPAEGNAGGDSAGRSGGSKAELPGSSRGGPFATGPQDTATDDVWLQRHAHALYPHIRFLLRNEFLLDRERRGRLMRDD